MAGSVKLVWFVPPSHLQATREAVFAAGAGRVGGYSRCSWSTLGEGTFLGDAGTSPTVGRAGEDVRVTEYRVETLVRRERLTEVVDALRRAHPYEEPAFDLIALVES